MLPIVRKYLVVLGFHAIDSMQQMYGECSDSNYLFVLCRIVVADCYRSNSFPRSLVGFVELASNIVDFLDSFVATRNSTRCLGSVGVLDIYYTNANRKWNWNIAN